MRLIFAVSLMLALAPSLAHAKRIALVIGNDDYANVSKLQKAVNDATAIASTLKDTGFQVMLKKNADRQAMNNMLGQLSAKIEAGDEVLFYFSGHGVGVRGENYLLPTDIPQILPSLARSITKEAFSEDEIIALMKERGAKVSIMIIDACRNNPFPKEGARGVGRSVGLARTQAPAEGTFIMYSAGIGQEALDRLGDDDKNPNSIFTRKLLPLLKTPGLDIAQMTKGLRLEVRDLALTAAPPYQNHNQFPAYYDQMEGNFYFVPSNQDETTKGIERGHDADDILWATIKDSHKVSDYDFYLKEHPKGRYSSVAKLKRQQLQQQKLALKTPPKSQMKPEGEDTAEALFQKGESLFLNINSQKEEVKQAFSFFSKAADLGHAGAMAYLASFYHYGDGVKKDTTKAIELVQKALPILEREADQGLENSMYVLGVLYMSNAGVQRNYTKAIYWLKKAAQKGHIKAMIGLGRAFNDGEGVEKDFGLAKQWFEKAAEKGSVDAMYYLGVFYEEGFGDDKALAKQWFQKAAEQGDSEAMYRLGYFYEGGYGVKQDSKIAAFWMVKSFLTKIPSQGNAISLRKYSIDFRKEFQSLLRNKGLYSGKIDGNLDDDAIEQILQKLGVKTPPKSEMKIEGEDTAEALYQKGEDYYYGRGVTQDYEKALEWYQKATEKGHIRAMYELGHMYQIGRGVAKDEARGTRLLQKVTALSQKAAKAGDTSAMFVLGEMYQLGIVVTKNYSLAVKWYTKAANKEHTDAMYNLAFMYEMGYGVKQDEVQAIKWYQKAANKGLSYATDAIKRLSAQ